MIEIIVVLIIVLIVGYFAMGSAAPAASSAVVVATPVGPVVVAHSGEPLGSPVQCIANDLGRGPGAVYRVTGNKVLQWYPNPPIASSWDPNWPSNKGIDCAGYTLGPDLGMK